MKQVAAFSKLRAVDKTHGVFILPKWAIICQNRAVIAVLSKLINSTKTYVIRLISISSSIYFKISKFYV